MADTCNCSTDISREHWVSKSILKQIFRLNVYGLPGPGPAVRRVGLKALTAKVLCRRHNSALHKLDTAAGDAFGCVYRALRHVARKPDNRKPTRLFIIDGHALELWYLKLLCGVHFGRLAYYAGKPTHELLQFDHLLFVKALSDEPLSKPFGLYYTSHWKIGTFFNVATLVTGDHLGGIRVSFNSFTLDCVVSEMYAAVGLNISNESYRPSAIALNGVTYTSNLVFAWKRGPVVGDGVCLVRWPPDPIADIQLNDSSHELSLL